MRVTSTTTSTSIALGLAMLAGPGAAQAQEVPNCAAGAGVPCIVESTGETITEDGFAALPVCVDGAADTDPCATADGDVIVGVDAAAQADQPVTGEAAAPAGEAPAAAAEAPAENPVPPASVTSTEDAAATTESAPESDANAAATAPEGEATQPVATNEDTPATDTTAPAGMPPADGSAATVAAPAAAPDEDAATAETAPETTAPADAAATAETAPAASAPSEAATTETAPDSTAPDSTAPTAEAAATAETAPTAAAPVAPAESASQENAATAQTVPEASAGQDSAGSAAVEASDTQALEKALGASQDAGADTAPADAVVDTPPAAAAAADTGSASADTSVAVEEETVTDENARSSSEEFATTVGSEQASAESKKKKKKKADKDSGGLSNFEKALVVGLGAVAVGKLLNNGDEVVSNSGDRVVVLRNGEYRVLKNDDALLRQPGSDVKTERFSDGSARETVTKEDGVQIVTIRGADGSVLRRTRVFPDGTRVVLFDDTQESAPVVVSQLPAAQAQTVAVSSGDEAALRRALEAEMTSKVGRSFSLRQVRDIREVRELAPEIEVDAITFETGSSAIRPDQAQELAALGRALRDLIEQRPGEVFLVEGHTDAVGAAEYNLALSDRRAETVALALTEYFDVPPENLVVQGYGEAALKVPTQEAERQNRRATVRRITPLLGTEVASKF